MAEQRWSGNRRAAVLVLGVAVVFAAATMVALVAPPVTVNEGRTLRCSSPILNLAPEAANEPTWTDSDWAACEGATAPRYGAAALFGVLSIVGFALGAVLMSRTVAGRPIASKEPREEGIDWSLPGDDR